MYKFTTQFRQIAIRLIPLVGAAAALAGCGAHGPSSNASPAQVQQIMQQAKANGAVPPGGPNYVRPSAATTTQAGQSAP